MIERVTRSLTLLRVFVVLSALVLGVAGSPWARSWPPRFGGKPSTIARRRSLNTSTACLGGSWSTGTASRSTAGPLRTRCAACTAAATSSASRSGRPDGVLAWTTPNPGAHRAPLRTRRQHLGEALKRAMVRPSSRTSRGQGEHAGRARGGHQAARWRSTRRFAPDDGKQLVGAFEVYADARPARGCSISERGETRSGS